jgi:hypothetical protein
MTAFHTCAHTWETIGSTTYTGLTWRQPKDLLYCPACGTYGVRTTVPEGYHSPMPQGTLLAIQAQEAKARRALLAEHRAKMTAEREAAS